MSMTILKGTVQLNLIKQKIKYFLWLPLHSVPSQHMYGLDGLSFGFACVSVSMDLVYQEKKTMTVMF